MYPSKVRTTGAVLRALLHFQGDQKITHVFGDNATEFKHAAAKLVIPIDTSIPHVPQGNGIAERAVRTIMQGARVLLCQAHMPFFTWHLAACFYSCAINFQARAHGMSP